MNKIDFIVVVVSVGLMVNVSFGLPEIISDPIVNPSNNHIYYLLEQSTWTESELKAVEMGGHLVTINDQAENDWVYDTFVPLTGLPDDHSYGDLWIGLTDVWTEGIWQWVSGETSTFVNWTSIEPSGGYTENYAMIWGPYWYTHLPDASVNIPGQWNDLRNDYWNDYFSISPHAVVEIVPEPATLSLVALGGLLLRRKRK